MEEGSGALSRLLAGRYRLGSALGSGAQGQVWAARDELTQEELAVKLLRREHHADPARVRQEIAALRTLRLPGVVRLLEEGVDEGETFLVMERLSGLPFPGVGPAPVPWERLAETVRGLFETLGRVHAAGVVHRDLKPANVLVDEGGRPTVLDFGFAHLTAERQAEEREGPEGTPAYLAPEQFRGDPASPAADLYAAGVMLYEALTGAPPHEGRDLMSLMRARLTRPPAPVRSRAPSVPPVVAELLERLLQVDPLERPRSAAEALSLLAGSPSGGAPALPWLGGREDLARALEAVLAGRSVTFVGSAGSGRTRALQELARELTARGRAARWVPAGQRAFESLGSLLPPLEGCDALSLAAASERLRAQLSAALGDNDVLLLDDAEGVDRASAALLATLEPPRPLARALLTADGAGLTVELRDLEARDLEALFRGPDRLLHLREDAARALWARTQGRRGAVSEELAAWVRAGLATWDGERLALTRDTLDRFDAGARGTAVAVRLASDAPTTRPLAPSQAELLSWVALAGAGTSAGTLSAALGRPLWAVEHDLGELARASALRVGPQGVEALRELYSVASWAREQQQAAHRRLAEVLPRGAPGRLFHLLAGGDEQGPGFAPEVRAEALRRASAQAKEGQLGAAAATLEEALWALWRAPSPVPEDADALLQRWTEYALAEGTPRAAERALSALCRTRPATEERAHLEALLRAALAVGAWTERALELAEAVAPFAHEGLERQRKGLRVAAARRCSLEREQQVVAELVRAGGAPDGADARALAGWLGRLRYREGRFEEAAALQSEAAREEPWVTARLAALLNGASACLEAHRWEDAQQRALTARELARGCRHAFAEGRAEWLRRCAAYRGGDAGAPDLELAEATTALHAPELEGYVHLTEAAIAWRLGDDPTAQRLARHALGVWSRMGSAPGALLAGGLLVASGGALPEARRRELAASALRCPLPAVTLQVLALLGAVELDPALRRHALEVLAPAFTPQQRAPRREVLSLEEALARLRA